MSDEAAESSVRISFPDRTGTDAREMAVELREQLLNVGVASTATIEKERDDTADLGSILVVVLSAPAVTVAATQIAAGIADWIRARATRRRDEEAVTMSISVNDEFSFTVTGSADNVRMLVEDRLSG